MTAESIARRSDTQAKLVREIVTPEGIPLRFTLAAAGDRAAAFVLDMVIQLGVLIVIGIGIRFASPGASWLRAAIVVLSFFIANFYFSFFEVRWQGATPGKRRIGIRVIDARGGQLETSAVLARNLVRELEVWMPLRLVLANRMIWPDASALTLFIATLWPLVFLLMPLFNRDKLRVGDMIAGTRVVLQPKTVLLPDLVVEAAATPAAKVAAFTFTEGQLAVYGIYELQVLEGLLRKDASSIGHHEAVFTVSEKIRTKLSYLAQVTEHERFLRDFYAALRAHLEQKMLFGHRRADKHARK